MSQFVTGTRLRLAEFVRRPTTLALLVGVPPVVIEVYGTAMTSFPALPSMGTDPATAGRMTGALFSVAFLAGVVGLFQVISARSGDERLALCGFRRPTLLATRLVTMVVVAGIGAAVAYAAFTWRVAVAAPAVAFGVLVLAGLTYGVVGVLVGAVLPRELEGSLVLVFLADVDNALSSGLFDSDLALARAFPMYHPHAAFEQAVFEGTVATGHLAWSLGYLAVVAGAAVAVYTVASGEGGVLP